ncbi:MAG: hypothetical protein M4579_004819 [Chaenotheca gracillima]|nr:MAG: hypothetical protein M4579_004819 [Chaenotheca gracillima]
MNHSASNNSNSSGLTSMTYSNVGPAGGALQPGATNGLEPNSTIQDGRLYTLDVVQQPVRARMCGFGDKDRRPITPPPCVRLIVKDAKTMKEVDINEIDTSFYVLTVDLWSPEGTREVNLVRHSATSPSISAAVSSSYPPPSPTHQGYPYAPNQPPYQPYGPPGQQGPPSGHPVYQGQHGPPSYYHPGPPGAPLAPQTAQQYYGQPVPQNGPGAAPPGMFTRNLIGSLSASAFRLTDPSNKIGVWFILQDLSVRTEGSGTSLNMGSAPVLASCFSEIFQVFSAKKFPGVIESTPLSKCFATQGIKIPIRKDGPKAMSNREEYDNDE